MSRIAAAFQRLAAEGRKALIPFITAGDPDREATVGLMHALVAGGADIVELGVPFSDPMADGPTIQRSSERALRHGTSLSDVLGMVRAFRATDTATPVVLMGYANPIEAMGIRDFAQRAQVVGVDGVLVVDYPPEESEELVSELARNNLDAIFLLSPTSTEQRMREVARVARGYIYYVSLKGVTGAGHLDLADVRSKIPRIRSHISLPIGVGFGIRDASTAHAIAQFADAVVIGSRLVEEIERSPAAACGANLIRLLREIRSGMDGTA